MSIRTRIAGTTIGIAGIVARHTTRTLGRRPRARLTAMPALALAMLLGLAACGSTGDGEPGANAQIQPNGTAETPGDGGGGGDGGGDGGGGLMPGEPHWEPTGDQPEEVNSVDLHFLGMMVPHHEQAVEMSDIVLAADGISPATRDLAQRIKDGQQQEIDVMEGYADEWGQADLMEFHSPHVANGMLTAEQMDQLRVVEGDEAERIFLELMHFHHEGAIDMTRDQVERGGYAPLRDLAQTMIDVQTAEMREMEGLLAR